METYQDLAKYLERVLGQPPGITPFSDERLNTLPLFLRSSYHFVIARIYDTEFVLALAKGSELERTPAEYANHVDTMERLLGQRVALALPRIPAYKRNRLVHKRIPFVVPECQLFLPTLFIDLRERFLRPTNSGKHLAASTQALLLYYLLGNRIENVPLQDLAQQLRYSAMTLSNVSKELEHIGISSTERRAKSLSITFAHPRKELWEMTLGKMRSPVKKTHWASFQPSSATALKAGTTALSELSLLSDDQIPTYAMHKSLWAKTIRARQSAELQDMDGAATCIEEWQYDPFVLSNGPVVDPLSLYLSLRTSDDERVRSAIDQIIENMTW